MKITSGSAGGRIVAMPQGVEVRPTSDKVKQALFNRLGADFRGKKVLDLFCGSGNLGLEALSRGAQRVIFADRHARCAANAGDHAMAFGFDAGRWNAVSAEWEPALRRLALLGESFDVVFLDPPYRKGYEAALLNSADLGKVTRPSAQLSLEHDAAVAVPPESEYWLRQRQDQYGESTLSLYLRKAGA
jgi:16S rRNA (guanine(966)-N(2))-methyltransferase RsmD